MRKKAKERILSGKPSVKFSEDKGETLEKIAGFVGVSRPTLKKVEDIVTAAEQQPEKYQPILNRTI